MREQAAGGPATMPPREDTRPFEMACRATCKAEFVSALILLFEKSGLSYRRLALKTGRQVPRTTVYNLIKKKQFPAREVQLRAFLAGCNVPQEAIILWVKEWQRLLAD
ncbi:hypothetical protein [Lentzea sp. CA-135723]|uniref:hypothetical protein n=1 Tax=Lentzea sp. CA-135723 TaxID=3239950 RepID=UPI003D8E4703